MGWVKREPIVDLLILDDGEGHATKVGGLLIGIPHDRGYDKDNYEIVTKSGDVVILSGSASLQRQITAEDIGKFLTIEFTGWGKSPNGKFKSYEVNIWDGPLTDSMKRWPKPASPDATGNGKPPVQATKPRVTAGAPAHDARANSGAADFEEFPGALEDASDDLPF